MKTSASTGPNAESVFAGWLGTVRETGSEAANAGGDGMFPVPVVETAIVSKLRQPTADQNEALLAVMRVVSHWGGAGAANGCAIIIQPL